MNDAREQIRSEEYEKALESLDNALIENPNSKDALSLKEMALERHQKEIDLKESEEFASDTSLIHSELVLLTDGIDEEASYVSIKEAKELMIKLNTIQEKLNKLNERWSSSKQYSSSFGYLNGAADDLNQTLTAIIENIYEPIDYNGDYSRKNKVEKYLTSNDSGIRAKRYISDFRLKIDSFESSLRK
ncbi:hypothetical protein [Paenibacillus amylolyticus]|uniref:hypothetical protein n=1 Tax=Paenibacillus amylolyticus TaxID=1451 RepID=UPI0015C2E228|nr:hypothetical protein [Paenibacillus amylolyticus]